MLNEGIDVKDTVVEVKRPRFQGELFYLSTVLLHTDAINFLSLSVFICERSILTHTVTVLMQFRFYTVVNQ